ncbi:MAG: hypothetical protein K2J72_08140 [Oscillospiraceae bacterium]|nr:hypothetical protein [Oscillospiraceae bacterium]
MGKKPYRAKKVKLDKKFSMAAYTLTLAAAVVARTVQLQTNVNFATGKYVDPSPVKNYAMWVLIIGFILISAIMIMGQSRDKAIKSCILINPMRLRSERLAKKVSPVAAAVMILMAGLTAFDIIIDLSAVAEKNAKISTEDNPVFAFAGIPALTWIIYVCALITIVTFVSTASNILKGEGVTKGNCVFLMFFPIWKLLEIFSMFSENQLVGVYSEKVYIMLTAMTSSMFFIYAARVFAGFEKKSTRIFMCIFGYAASIFAAVSVLPRYISYFTLSYYEREGMTAPETSDVGIAVVTIAIVAVFWSTYVYRVMPKLNLTGKRRWMKTTVAVRNMQSIDDE